MGLRKGTLTFSRYRLIGAQQDHFLDFFNERIRRNAFQSRLANSGREGCWLDCPLDDPLDTEFQFAAYAQGRYLLFCLRVDRKSVPPALLRLRITEAERKKLTETGQKKLYREQREAIREAVRLDLIGKTLPAPAFFEICWSFTEKRLIFCALSDKIFEEFQELFRESFQLTLSPYTPWDVQFTERTGLKQEQQKRHRSPLPSRRASIP